MKYEIKKIGRIAELNDDLVNEYTKYSELKDSLFTLFIRIKYGKNFTKDKLSDDELSFTCNEAIFNELKALDMFPKALNFLENNYEQWMNGKMQEHKIGE